MSRYLFKSSRLGFRNWQSEDLGAMAAINADPAVMKYFPGVQNSTTTKQFIQRMQEQFARRGYTYFAVELLELQAFIGFIGLSYHDFSSPWSPFTDIGWRLDKRFWGQGLATEGARQVLEFAFHEAKLSEVTATAPTINRPSIRVIEKIGMTQIGKFNHPKLAEFPDLQECLMYRIIKGR